MALRFEGDSAQFSIAPAEGATDVIPASRDWTVTFRGIAPEAMHAVRATVDALPPLRKSRTMRKR